MKIHHYRSGVLYAVLLLSPFFSICCPNCDEPEIFPFPVGDVPPGFCYTVTTFCRSAQGYEPSCPAVLPVECLYGDEAPQICFKVTNWCGLGDWAEDSIGLEIAGQQFNFWTENITLSWPGATFEYCVDFDELSNFYTPNQAFSIDELPTVYLTIDGVPYPTPQVIIPTGGVAIGNLVSDENYQWSESFPVQSNLSLKSCLGDPPQSISGSIGITFSESIGWSIGGTISLGGQGQLISGSFSGSQSGLYSSGISYGTSISGYLPVVEEEDCAPFGDTNCEHCCFHLNAALEQEIHQYQLVEYSCYGIPEVQDELIPIVADYGSILFTLGSFITCPNSPLYLHPKKIYGDGNRFISHPSLGIQIDEFLDFDYYTLTWVGPNGFSETNQTLLENLEPGEYCYTLAHCGCDEPVDKGCIVLCPDASPASEWSYNEEKELYCRAFTCGQTTGMVEECVDAAPCSDWEYNETDNECFREICHEDELLFVEANAPYDISYEYQNSFCKTIITCLEGGEELIIETAPEYSDAFFDESDGACYRYVLCGGSIAGSENVGIDDVIWEYNDSEGCVGRIYCNESSFPDGEVSGTEVETHLEEWSYDEQNGCLRDATCSYLNDFEERLYGVSSAETQIYWEYDDQGNTCLGTVSCDGSIIETLYDYPHFGEWDENAALYSVECIREAFCGSPFHFEMQFEDYGDILVSFESGPCVDGYKPCYIQIACDAEVVVGNDLVAEIPCEDYCGGNEMRQRISRLLTGTQSTNCGVQFILNPANGLLFLESGSINGEKAERIIIVEMSTGRIVKQITPAAESYQQTQSIQLPGKSVYALISYTRSGRICYSKIVF